MVFNKARKEKELKRKLVMWVEGNVKKGKTATDIIRSHIPGCVVLYGVHAITSESVREKTEPFKVKKGITAKNEHFKMGG